MNAEQRTPDAAGANEVAFRFGPGGGLFGVYHAAEGNTVVVFCAPFAEEHKSAYRTFVEAARALAAAGTPCLRFDYYGTGDSAGDFAEFRPSRAIEDITAATAKAREMGWADLPGGTPGRAGNIVLLGLRLGGTLALAAAAKTAASSVVLWQPVVSGKAFFDLTILQQMLRRQLIGKADKAEAGAPLLAGDIIDFDGFPLSQAAAEEIRQLDCLKAAEAYAGRVRLLQISHAEVMSREFRPLADALGDRLTFAAVRCEPFWNRIDLTDASPVIRQTLGWLKA